ncbi:hypothetical protein [Mycolicibacterium moriokaense]|uniref:Uncharacterized protein n=1 Tax=Mycolicibacterium moriokaense TaxID=39691 RepID=A0A318HFR9_9MYCO|nr:hypothetical protein [Mycolicibacterium moriokaense]PXX01540.1 hypothetical protein C8E89_12826 [Mycolicibacterium moriokaense]
MQTWLYRLPLAARAAVTGAWVFAALFGVTQLATLQASSAMFPNSVAARAVMAAIAGVVAGVIGVVVGDQRIRRVYGSTEQAITYSQSLRTGHLPEDIEPAAWQRWLDVSRQSMRWTPATVTLFAALALLNSLAHQWALVALLVIAAVWSLGYGLVLRRRILRLATAIDQRETAPG